MKALILGLAVVVGSQAFAQTSSYTTAAVTCYAVSKHENSETVKFEAVTRRAKLPIIAKEDLRIFVPISNSPNRDGGSKQLNIRYEQDALSVSTVVDGVDATAKAATSIVNLIIGQSGHTYTFVCGLTLE